MGGMLVMAVGFIIWGFIAHRFVPRDSASRGNGLRDQTSRRQHHAYACIQSPERSRAWMAVSAIALLAMAPRGVRTGGQEDGGAGREGPATTLERIKSSGSLKLGYRTDARPFSFQDASGSPRDTPWTCARPSVRRSRAQLGVADLKVEWVPVTVDNQLKAVEQHEVDVLCAAVTVTLKRREQVDFSLPIFPGGVGVVVRSDCTEARCATS